MDVVTISPKFQVVIPRAIRERLGLTPGQQLQVVANDGHMELIPVRPMSEYRGFLAGMDTTLDRDDDRY